MRGMVRQHSSLFFIKIAMKWLQSIIYLLFALVTLVLRWTDRDTLSSISLP
jgi:hypothetical protein